MRNEAIRFKRDRSFGGAGIGEAKGAGTEALGVARFGAGRVESAGITSAISRAGPVLAAGETPFASGPPPKDARAEGGEAPAPGRLPDARAPATSTAFHRI